MAAEVEIRRMGPHDLDRVLASAVFDGPAQCEWTRDFLDRRGHHLFLASVRDEVVGFVSGVEIVHPDKGAEMLLYELGVEEPHRRRGIGRALVVALREEAARSGCRGMWVPTDRTSPEAIATYRAAGASTPEDGVIMTWTFDAPG